MINLSEKLGEMTFDGLITDIKPAPEVRGGVIRKLSAAATLKRGTILAKSSGTAGDGKLVVLGTAAVSNETLTPDCILCDDIEVGTAADETCPKCGGEMYQRDDDNEATVRNRLDVYEKSTAPLIDYYRGCDLLVSIDGDRDPNVVYADVKKALGL